MNLSPFAHILGPSTPEQRKLALEHTRETLTQLRDLVQDLDLPADAIELAKEIYGTNLAGLMASADEVKQKARRKKMNEKLKAMGANRQYGTTQMQQYAGLGPDPYGLLDDDDDE